MLSKRLPLPSHLLNLMWHCQPKVGTLLLCLIPRCGRVNASNPYLLCIYTLGTNSNKSCWEVLEMGRLSRAYGTRGWESGLQESVLGSHAWTEAPGPWYMLHYPIRLHLPNTYIKIKLQRISRQWLQSIKPQAQGFSEHEYLYGCTSNLSMNLVLLFLNVVHCSGLEGMTSQ